MRRFSERDCANFIKKILEALKYLHSKNIVHRDIKCANIVFDNPDIKNSKLKLIDFGQAELITDYKAKDNSIIGSCHYLCPEITRQRTKFELFAGDIWSTGIICYMLVNGAVPFCGENVKAVLHNIQTQDIIYQKDIKLSDSCKQFIGSLLNKNPKYRLNAKQALKHEWIIEKARNDDLGDNYFNKLSHLHFQNKLQKILVNAILSGMDETSKKALLSHINELKKSGNGYIDENEIIRSVLSWASDINQNGQKTKNKRYSSKLLLNAPFIHEPAFTQESLNKIDIDNILNEIDQENKSHKNPLQLKLRLSDISSININESDDEDENEEIGVPKMQENMSVEQFVKILESGPKKYNVDEIVANLTPADSNINDNFMISFQDIASYHQAVDSLI